MTNKRSSLQRAAVAAAAAAFGFALQAPASPLPTIDAQLVTEVSQIPPRPAKRVAGWKDVFAAARAHSADLHIADQESQFALGQYDAAFGRALPQITASATVRRDLLTDHVCDPVSLNCSDGSALFGGISLTQRLLDLGTWSGVRGLGRTAEARQLSAVDKRRLLTLALMDGVAAVLLQERLGNSARQALQDSARRTDLVREAVRLGSQPTSEVVLAEQDLTVTLRRVVEADDALLHAEVALGALLGQANAVGVERDFDLRSVGEGCTPVLAEQRADVDASRLSLEAAGYETARARASFLPTIDLVTALGYSSIPFVSDRHGSWVIGGSVTLPLWDGMQRVAELRSARAAAGQARERQEQTAKTATLEAAEASLRQALAKRALKVADEDVRLAAQTEGLTRAAMQAGGGTVLELIESGRRLRESQAVWVAKEIELMRADVRLKLISARCDW